MKRIILGFVIASISISSKAAENSNRGLGNLNWGPIPLSAQACIQRNEDAEKLKQRVRQSKKTDNLAALAKNVIKRGKEELNDTITAVKTISVSDHSFFFQKEYKVGEQVSRDLRKLLHISICARLESSSLADKCREKALKAIEEWVSTYKPSGQPIDESRLISLLQSIDLMQSQMSQVFREKSKKWLKELISKSDEFFKSEMLGHDPADKNWNTWRVAIRSVASQVLDDKSEIQKSAEQIRKQIQDNFVRDSQGKTDGPTVDFVERDALHYHVYNMKGWLTAANLTPCSLSSEDKTTVLAGLEFLKPYYLGQKEHIEFVNTKIEEDRARGKAGDQTYQPHIWKAGEGEDAWLNRGVIRWARPGFPAVRPWTKAYVDPEYDASDKFLAKLWGEPENSN